jgi:hypothetical protein
MQIIKPRVVGGSLDPAIPPRFKNWFRVTTNDHFTWDDNQDGEVTLKLIKHKELDDGSGE